MSEQARDPERSDEAPVRTGSQVVVRSSDVKHVDEREIDRFWLLRRVGRHPKALQPCW
jgi:hypothetical protein